MTDLTSLAVGDLREVEIGPVAHGGHFIAHSDERTLFVRHALPGESVRVRITSLNRKIVRADAVEVLSPSADRVAPPCRWAHADGCGGCDFQHVRLEAQRELKREVLADALRRFGGLDADQVAGLDVRVEELPGHPDGMHWRTRVRWATGKDGTRGLHAFRSSTVVPVDRCLIAAEGVDRPEAPAPDRVTRTVRDRQWRLPSDGFWQVHDALPEALVASVLDFAAPRPGDMWWDLYSGAGLFAAFLGQAVGPQGRVDAVEASGEAVRAARRALRDLSPVRLHHSPVEAWIDEIQHDAPDGVVLDPPRAGAGRSVLSAIAGAEVPVIVYVACDPVALGRDISLLGGHGYRLERLRSFDAFPMTHHLETVAVLRRAD